MKIVSGCDEHRPGIPIGPDLIRIRGGESKLMLAGAVIRIQAFGGTDTAKIDSRFSRNEGQQNHSGEVARPHEADAQFLAAGGRRPELDAAPARRRSGRILQQDSQRRLALRGDQLVGLGGTLDRETMGGESFDRKLTGRHQLQGRLHVSLSRPAGVPDRIVVPSLFIARIAAPRAERKGDRELELFGEKRWPRQIETRDAHQHDSSFRPASRGSELDRLIAGGRSGNHHRVHALSFGKGLNRFQRSPRIRLIDAELRRKLEPLWIQIDAEDLAALRLQKGNADLTYQAQANDENALAQRNLGEANTLHRDCRQRRVCGLFEIDSLRDARTQILADRNDARVRGHRGDPVSRLEILHSPPALQHDSRRRVAQWKRFVELCRYRSKSAEQSFLFELSEYSTDVLRTFTRLADQRFPGQLHQGAL